MDKQKFLIEEYVNKQIESSGVLARNKTYTRELVKSFMERPCLDLNKLNTEVEKKCLAIVNKPDTAAFEAQLFNARIQKLFYEISKRMKHEDD
jgi:hypothetical protein